MKYLLATALVLLTTTAQADTPQRFAGQLARQGRLYHDPSYNGRENVYMSSSTRLFGHRMAARRAWMNSPGHRANLPMFFLRVARGPNGTYVVGRK